MNNPILRKPAICTLFRDKLQMGQLGVAWACQPVCGLADSLHMLEVLEAYATFLAGAVSALAASTERGRTGTIEH